MGVQQNAPGGKGPDRWYWFVKVSRGEMIKAPSDLQELRRRIYRKAKSIRRIALGDLRACDEDANPPEAYRVAKRNRGARASTVRVLMTSKHQA